MKPHTGSCDLCRRRFAFELVHSGMNRCAYAYCSECGIAGLLEARPAKRLRGERHGMISSCIEAALAPCGCGGRFLSGSAPRCPACRETLDPDQASAYIDPAVQPVAAGWKWQKSWQGLYCIVVEKRTVSIQSLLTLIPIQRNGAPLGFDGELSSAATEVLSATEAMYKDAGFHEPWIGYLVLAGGTAVGTCGFKSAPVSDRVEIAYFTFPEFEGKGYATAMTTELIGIASRQDPHVQIVAQTLPERTASHRILEKLGFRNSASLEHPEDGTVREWILESEPTGVVDSPR